MYTSRPFGEASAMYGRTQPSPDMMQRVAGYLGVDIDYFREYRMQRLSGIMEARPDLTGKMYEYALSLLEEGDDERARSQKRN
jgi:transcriptional regulator with XRE-family HTH domain